MKNILLTILVLPIISNAKVIEHFKTDSNGKKIHLFYEETFPTITLRHGNHYTFSNIFNAKKMLGFTKMSVDVTSSGYSKNDNKLKFDWTKSFKDEKYIINKNTSKRIVKSNQYDIYYHPKIRKQDNILITYFFTYMVENEENKVWEGPYNFHSIQPYEITWCGDGVLDNYKDIYANVEINEICDPNDMHKKRWGKIGCSKTCTPID